eukprot:jgi/Botrbrau1/19929/Bobra.0059s0046.1
MGTTCSPTKREPGVRTPNCPGLLLTRSNPERGTSRWIRSGIHSIRDHPKCTNTTFLYHCHRKRQWNFITYPNMYKTPIVHKIRIHHKRVKLLYQLFRVGIYIYVHIWLRRCMRKPKFSAHGLA